MTTFYNFFHLDASSLAILSMLLIFRFFVPLSVWALTRNKGKKRQDTAPLGTVVTQKLTIFDDPRFHQG
jgi:hypothetical protein